jgi:CubicO group peptidase (beta-lactamase class C family)
MPAARKEHRVVGPSVPAVKPMQTFVLASRGFVAVVAAALLAAPPSRADANATLAALSADTQRRIDTAAAEVLAKTGAASASVAIVRDGRIAYLQAYGDARLEPRLPAQPGTRYAIGSISKQFTAAALLLLEQDGKLSLDDRIERWVPGLTRGRDITIRQLLSHTAGYQDYWPQDYMFPRMREPATSEFIMETWARKPLDYEPGTRWQYSNTGYIVAARIVEQASGEPLFSFLRKRIFVPLGMDSVIDFDREPHAAGMAEAYTQYALGPSRVAEASAPGWLFGAGQLAMTAEDLARWNVSLIRRELLSRASHLALETDTRLASGAGTQYGLGTHVEMENHRRKLGHGGAVNGFTSENVVYPDDGAAIVVLVNQDASPAPAQLSGKLVEILFEDVQPADAVATARARAIFEGLQQGRLDRGQFTANANHYFSTQAIADFQASLAPLGAPTEFRQARRWLRGGMTGRSYDAKFAGRTLRVWTYEMPDGRLEQFQVAVRD